MSHKVALSLKNDQRLIMSYAMKQALLVLQLPILQLENWVEKEIENNPLLELLPSLSKQQSVTLTPSFQNAIQARPTRYEYLQREIAYHFTPQKEKELAYYIAGCLDEKGFLTLSDQEICLSQNVSQAFLHQVLRAFHSIEPIGMGARNVREALLIQLEAKKEESSLIYTLVKSHFEELLHRRFSLLAKKFKVPLSTLKSLIHLKLKSLNPFPGKQFDDTKNALIFPDLILEKEEDIWKVEVSHNHLPRFRSYPHYDLKAYSFSKEETAFIRKHLASGKWLKRILNHRYKKLLEFGKYLVKYQDSFLSGEACSPLPMTMQQVARKLEVNESTITRIVANKYISCPIGILKIRTLFTQAIQSSMGKVSNQKAKNLLIKLIEKEDKKHPLSDQLLSQELSKKGLPCSRRTVTKYRKEFSIATAAQRKES